MNIAAAEDSRPAAPKPRLAQPGRNCWRTARADHFGVVVDGADYFRALKYALLAAKRSILIIGWEFDSRTALVRGERTSEPNEIGPLLDHIVRTRPGLRAHVLIWDSAMIYAFNREFAGMVKMDWLTHRRLRFKLDDSHPIASSQHQKIVVVDEVLAFVGGFDITSQRWDSRDHKPLDPLRNDPAFSDYPPFHDIMAVVTGEAACALAEIGRERWRVASGEVLKVPRPGDAQALWPPFLPVLMRRVDVAIARTSPPWDGTPPVREVEQLYMDMIAAARRFIYVENQYFASRRIAELLADRLACADCPEIVLINPGEPASLVERSTMGVARARLARRMAEADGGGRLRIYY
ncbi:MAG: phospholipase, partial [Rhodospirillaceae bacterium]|nr:phospholipase [Rhodospirillales bacterium]